MNANRTSGNEPSADKEPDANALRELAERRPGIREVMRVYEDWKRVDRGMDAYRAATAWMPTATNHTNPKRR